MRAASCERLSAILMVAALAACGGNESPTETENPGATGSVMVTATTSGSDLDTEYSVSVAGSTQTLSANGDVTFTDVPVGTRTVAISGVAPNCTVAGSTSQSVTVNDGETATASFTVTCEAVLNVDALIAEAIDSLAQAMFAALNINDLSGLDGVSFEQTNTLFAQALAASPSNDTAAFGVAVTTIFLLEDDPGVRAAADQWEAWVEEGPDPVGPMRALFSPATPLTWSRTTLPLDFSGADLLRLSQSALVAAELGRMPTHVALAPPPAIATHQMLLSSVVAPALEDALAALQEIADPAFAFTVTPAMQGEVPAEADPLELDYTEVLALQAGIEVALASIGIVTAYDLEPNPTSVSGFVSAMTPGSTFLTLTSGGAASLSEALARLLSATDILLDGLDALEAETDDQTDDIIKYDPSGLGDGVSAADITEARDAITDAQGALAGPTTVTIEEGEPDELSFTLDAREFFVDPIADFKALLPAYEAGTAMEAGEQVILFRWTDLNLADWTFPDPTFSGILPGMTTQQLVDDFGLDDLFFEFSRVRGYYALISLDGVDCLDDYVDNGGGCSLDSNTTYTDGYISLDGYDGMPEAFVTAQGYDPQTSFSLFTSLHGPYTVTEDLGVVTVVLDLVDESEQPVMLSATYVDQPGYASTDEHGRARGGSTITFDHLGATWVFARQ